MKFGRFSEPSFFTGNSYHICVPSTASKTEKLGNADIHSRANRRHAKPDEDFVFGSVTLKSDMRSFSCALSFKLVLQSTKYGAGTHDGQQRSSSNSLVPQPPSIAFYCLLTIGSFSKWPEVIRPRRIIASATIDMLCRIFAEDARTACVGQWHPIHQSGVRPILFINRLDFYSASAFQDEEDTEISHKYLLSSNLHVWQKE